MSITWRDGITTLIVIGIGSITYLVTHGTHLPFLTNARLAIILLSLVGTLVWFLDFLPTMSKAHPVWSGLLAACGLVLLVDAFFGVITGVDVTVIALLIGIFLTYVLVTLEHLVDKKDDHSQQLP